MSDIMDRLRQMADLFETQQAPHNMVLHLRAAADEIARLRAGGCTRDQGTTQYCAEAAAMAQVIEWLRAALEMFACNCAVHERCLAPDKCRNFHAYRILTQEPRT